MDIVQTMLFCDVPAMDSYSLLLRNGCRQNDNPVQQLPEGVILGSFANMFQQFEHLYSDFSKNYDLPDEIPFDLNTKPCADGFFLYVPAGTKLSKPVQITHLFDEHNDTLIQFCNIVLMEAGSSAELLTSDHTVSGEPCASNEVTQILLGTEATLDLVRLQKVNNTTRLTTDTTVQQAASSRMKTHYLTLGGGVISNNLKVNLAGVKAGHTASGLSLTQQTEHAGNDIRMVHASPDCQSNQLFKHILSDKSTGAFTGRIVVNKDARKTSAYQRSSNILLHPKAKMNIRPQLEIYADDVKCSHGATVGQLDAEALFYLRSRGIGEDEARNLLLQAFAGEILDGIPHREFVLEMISVLQKSKKGYFVQSILQ